MALLILAVLALASGHGTQEATVFRTNAHLVQINVIVRDKNGPVTNLNQSDFILSDRGKVRPISVFSVHQRRVASSRVETTSPLPANTFSNRKLSGGTDAPAGVTMILFDRLNTLRVVITDSSHSSVGSLIIPVSQSVRSGMSEPNRKFLFPAK